MLHEPGAIRECEEHGWMQDRTDPHARDHATDIARHAPPPGFSAGAAAAEVLEVLAPWVTRARNVHLSKCPTLGDREGNC